MNRAKAFYFVYFAAAAALSPFLTIYYESLGLSGSQIGLLTGLVPVVTLFASGLWGAISDATRRYRAVLLVAISGVWLSVVAMLQVNTLAGLLPIVLLFAFFGAPISPVIDSSILATLGDRRSDYGRVRAWGSIGWGVSAFLMGPLLQRAGLEWAFYVYLGLMLVVLAFSWVLPVVGTERDGSFRSGLRRLLSNPGFLSLLGVAFVFGMTQAMVLGYLFLHLQGMGAGETLMSWSLVATVLTEIPLLFLAGRIINKFGVRTIILAALLLTAIRAFLLSLMPVAWWVLPINLLLTGPTFATFWAAGVDEAQRLAPPGLGATAQGALAGAMFGLGSGLGGLVGGVVYQQYGTAVLFQLAGGILLLALPTYWLLRGQSRPRPALLGTEPQEP